MWWAHPPAVAIIQLVMATTWHATSLDNELAAARPPRRVGEPTPWDVVGWHPPVRDLWHRTRNESLVARPEMPAQTLSPANRDQDPNLGLASAVASDADGPRARR